MRIVFLPRYGKYGASSRYRHFFLASWLNDQGYNTVVYPFFIFKRFKGLLYCFYFLRRFLVLVKHRRDLFYIEADVFPYLGFGIRPRNYFLDFDDPVWNWDKIRLGNLSDRKWYKLVDGAKLLVSGSTHTLNLWSERTKVDTLLAPTTFSKDFYESVNFQAEVESLTGCWIGSPSTSKFVDDLFKNQPEFSEYNWVFVGYEGELEVNNNILVLDWSKQNEIYAASISNFAISPLFGSSEEINFKCGFKIVQYLALGLNTFVNPVGPNLFFKDSVGVHLVSDSWVQSVQNTTLIDANLIKQDFVGNLCSELIFTNIQSKIGNVWY